MFEERIFQNHIRRVVGLENTEAKVMIDHYRRALKDLKGKMLTSSSNTFTEARLEISMKQVEDMIKALEHRIKKDMQESFDFMYENGVQDSVTEVNKMEKKFNGINNLVPLDAIFESTKPSNFLFNNFESSMQSYNSSIRTSMQNSFTQALIQKKTLSQVVADIEQASMLNEWKVHRIVRTELHQIYNISKMNGMGQIKKKYIPDLKKSMIHPMDERTGEDSKDLAVKNPIIDIDKPFKQTYNGKEITFFAPPNRPNDRAILVPIRASYDKDKG